jgi:hypothetical protein
MKPQKTKLSQSPKELVRIAFRLHGPELDQVREVREMLSLNTELDAVRYLMQRGLEAMTATLSSRRTHAHMMKQVNTEVIVQTMLDKGFVPDESKQ